MTSGDYQRARALRRELEARMRTQPWHSAGRAPLGLGGKRRPPVAAVTVTPVVAAMPNHDADAHCDTEELR